MTDFAYQIKENYRLCEYIESSEFETGPCIDTGWKFTKSGQTEIIVDFATVDAPDYTHGTAGFGSFNYSSEDEVNIPPACSVNMVPIGKPSVNLTSTVDYYMTKYKRTTFKFTTNNKWSIDGNEVDDASDVQTNNFCLLGLNIGISKVSYGGRFYRFIVIEDNKIVKHMVPVINSKNVPGMYDLITKQFYINANPNSTTDFGYRVAHNLLPFGYKECEWIENIGSEDAQAPYLDTEWTLTSDKVSHSHITLKTKSQASSSRPDCSVFGTAGTAVTDDEATSQDGVAYCALGIFGNSTTDRAYWRFNIQEPSQLSVPVTKDAMIFEFRNDNYWYSNGTKVPGHSESGASLGSLLMFNRNRRSGTSADTPTPFRIYYCKIEENDVLVRDFVPCVNPEGQVGMFDRVHGKFHGNINTNATKTFKYQVKDQVWPSYLSRVSWIQSTCSYPTASDGVAPYIMLQTQQVDKNNGFKVLVACDNTVQTTPGTNYPGKAILAHRLPNYAGIYWYPKTATQTGPSQFKYGDLTTTAPTAISTADLAKGFNNTYLVEVNYTADNKAEYVNTDTVTTRANTTPTLGNNTNTAPLYLFTSGIHEDFHNTDTHTIRLYDAEVTQYENVIHHYVPCLDTNLNKPCVFDTKTGDIFYEVEDTNVHDHLTYGY